MPDRDPELERLLKAKRLASRRCELLRGYPPDDQAAALAELVKAKRAVRNYCGKLS